MTALSTVARLTSFWVIAPTPRWMTRMPTSSDTSIFIRESSSASTEPEESPLMTMLSMSTSDLANCSLRLSSETILRRFASCAARSVAWRFSAIWRAVRSSDATRKRSPAVGTDVRPSTCTGVDGVASFMWLPFSSSMARTRPYEVPATMASPMRRVPCCTSTVATAPRPLSSRASTVAPRASISGFARRSRSASAVSSTASSSLSTLVPCLAEMSTNMVSPPYSSGTRPNSVS